MKRKIFALKDAKQGFCNIYVENNQLIMLRNLEQAVNDETTLLFKYPQDFSLYQLGEVDTDTGSISVEFCFIEEMINLKKK